MASVMLAALSETWPVHHPCEVKGRHERDGMPCYTGCIYIHLEIAALTLSLGGPLAQWTRVCVSEAQSPVFEPRMVLERWLSFCPLYVLRPSQASLTASERGVPSARRLSLTWSPI